MILANIQSELKAPKGQFNNFGKYKYRSCEDIVEAVKPVLFKHSCWLNITDDIVQLGDRYYVKATASIMDEGGKAIASSSAFAREPLSKKGMDDSQITGTASSYARKYALNGLLAIDDTKDADTMDNRQQMNPEPIDEGKVEKAYAYIIAQIDDEEQDDVQCAENLKKAWPRLSPDEQMAVNSKLQKVKNGKRQYNTILKGYLGLNTNVGE